jgi:CheY-like chemotaxis protein
MKPEDQPSGEAARQQGAIVLVVEDEWIVRMAVADHLRGCGYRVLEAANADEAIAAFDANDEVALLFTDIQMPGSMDGFELARWVRREWPEVKIIMTSGVVSPIQSAQDRGEDGAFLAKPYSHPELIRRIRMHLAER